MKFDVEKFVKDTMEYHELAGWGLDRHLCSLVKMMGYAIANQLNDEKLDKIVTETSASNIPPLVTHNPVKTAALVEELPDAPTLEEWEQAHAEYLKLYTETLFPKTVPAEFLDAKMSPKVCDCGGAAAKTTHSHWCSSLK